MAFKLSPRAKRVVVAVAVVYLCAVLVNLFLVIRGRDTVYLPAFERRTLALPAERIQSNAGFREATARTRFLAAEAVPGVLAEHEELTEKLLLKLADAGREGIAVLDPAPLSVFAGKELKAAEEIKAPDGALLVKRGDVLEEEMLTRLLLARPELAGARVAVKGHGALLGADMTFLFAWLNYLAFAVIMAVVLWGPVTKALDERAADIRQNIDGASSARAQAEKLREDYANVVDEARKRMETLVEEGRQEGFAERERLVAAAREEAAREVERGQADLASQAERARRALLREVAGLSGELAGRVLGREVTAADHERLVDEFLSEVERGEG